MKLPESVFLCDAMELAAVVTQSHLSVQDLARQFFPGVHDTDEQAEIRDALALAVVRKKACGNCYPFLASDRSITAEPMDGFNAYLFLLLGRALNFGGPRQTTKLLERFRTHFEDLVCWSLRRAGFLAEVLSVPRKHRGLNTRLPLALLEVAERFGEPATLKPDALMPHDNDLDVDVLAVPVRGSNSRGGWPIFLIQCATEPVDALQRKIDEGAATFATVWEGGFFAKTGVRCGATPDDLLALHSNYWIRLNHAGWVLDRTRIAYLASLGNDIPVPRLVGELWNQLWAIRSEVDWHTGWRQGT